MKLTDRVVWVVSPFPADVVLNPALDVARALASLDNDVIYVGPQQQSATSGEQMVIEQVSVWNVPLPSTRHPWLFGRRHHRRAFDRASQLTGVRPDVVWSFDAERQFRFNHADTPYRVLHGSGMLAPSEATLQAAKHAHLCLSCNDVWHATMLGGNPNTERVNEAFLPVGQGARALHGLLARQVVVVNDGRDDRVDGGLLLEGMMQHPEAVFHLWGDGWLESIVDRPNAVSHAASDSAAFTRLLSTADLVLDMGRGGFLHQNDYPLLQALWYGCEVITFNPLAYADVLAVSTPDEWRAAVGALLDKGNPASAHSSEEDRRAFAEGRHVAHLFERYFDV